MVTAIETWLQPGTEVGGYTVERLLAAGGMARVFVAVQRNLGRRVTLKVLNEDLYHDSRFAERFLREAKIMSELSHSNVVTVHEFFEIRGCHFLVMEYVDGFDLDVVLSKVTPLAPEATLLILIDVARGLKEAHTRGLVHRDIKTANLLLSRSGVVKVTDFGIACESRKLVPGGRRLTSPGTVVGTPEFMAPEQIDGASPTPAVDMFGLGVVAFELLTGDVPFQGETLHEIRESMRNGFEFDAETAATSAVHQLVRSMLASSPDDRPPSMGFLEQRVHGILRNLDPSSFLIESRQLVLERLASDPASVCSDLSGARGRADRGQDNYRALFEPREPSGDRSRVIAAVSSLAEERERRAKPTERAAQARPSFPRASLARPRWMALGGLLLIVAATTLGEHRAPTRPSEDARVAEPSPLPMREDRTSDVIEETRLPQGDSHSRTGSAPGNDDPRSAVDRAVPPPAVPPPAAPPRARVKAGSGAYIYLDTRLVAADVSDVELSLAPDTEHRLEVRYPALFSSDIRTLRALPDQVLGIESHPPATGTLTLACSPPGPASVRFRGFDSAVKTPARLAVGAGTHTIQADRPGAFLRDAVVSRQTGSSTPVTPEVVAAVSGTVEFRVTEGVRQRVILRFEERPEHVRDPGQPPLHEDPR